MPITSRREPRAARTCERRWNSSMRMLPCLSV
jgi:hypothetical protein